MSYKTNRKTRGVFRAPIAHAGRPLPKPVGKIISGEPSIVSYEDSGAVYVENGSGQRYAVKYADGHIAEVEFSDAFDSETPLEEIGEEDDDKEPEQIYNMRVVWDGAVDFSESYDANNEDDRLGVIQSLINRYGKIAEDFTGVTLADVNEMKVQRKEDREEESFL